MKSDFAEIAQMIELKLKTKTICLKMVLHFKIEFFV